MKITAKKDNSKKCPILSELPAGATFVRAFHDLDAIRRGAYEGNWSLYMVLPRNSVYLTKGGAMARQTGHIHVFNLKKKSIHCIDPSTQVHPVEAEITF